MSVTIDHELLAVESLGLDTVGQVLSHVSRTNRLVVNLLIDGQQPDLSRIVEVRQSPIGGRTLFIETADPRGMASDVLKEVENQLDQANRLSTDCVTYLRDDKTSEAMQRLSGCFTIWQHAQESVLKTAQLLRVDLARINVGDRTLQDVVMAFSCQLKLIKTSLEDRDYVGLADILTYETAEANRHLRSALGAMRSSIQN